MKPNDIIAEYIHDYISAVFRNIIENDSIEIGDDCLRIESDVVKKWDKLAYSNFNQLSDYQKEVWRKESLVILRIFIGDDEHNEVDPV